MNFLELSKLAIEKIKSTQSTIQVVAHNDSVTGDSEILVDNEGKMNKMKFEDLYNYCCHNFGERRRDDGKTYSMPKKIKVFSVNKNGKIFLAKVRGIIKHRTNKKIYEVKSKIGTIKVTEDHSLMTLKNNKLDIEKPDKIKFAASPRYYKFGDYCPSLNLLDLKSILPEFRIAGKYIEIKRTKNRNKIPINITLDENILALFGMWIADGSYAKKKGRQGVHISCYNDIECKEIIDRVFKKFGTEKPTILDAGVTAAIGSSTLFNLMYVLDLKGYSSTKRVPGWIFGLKKNLMASFLRGYFSGDGTVSKGDINANSVSKKLLEDMQTLLLFFHIRSSVRKEGKSGYNTKHDGYKLSINANSMKKIFKKKIGFLQKSKNKKIKLKTTNKSNYMDYIPIENDLIEKLRKQKISKINRDGLLKCLKNDKKPTRYRLKMICKNLKKIDKKFIFEIINNDIFWETPKIDLISANRENEVYDIETEHGNFICNNFILKNSDGISAASILIYALAFLNKRFQVTITKKINSSTTDALLSRNPELIIFTDIGSSYPEEIRKLKSDIIILDHHDVKEELPDNVIHLNPEAFGLTGLSGSGTVYMFTRDIIKDNRLAPLALVGMIGDSADSMFNMFDDISSIGRKTGLKLYGRFTRPLHKALEYSSEIPNISDESKAIQFLAENGIQIKEGEQWRTLGDLNEQEYQKLCDSLIREQLEHGHDISKLFGDVWTLKNFPQEIQDVKEFATLLNACVTGDTMIYVNGIPIAIKNISNKNIFSINENLKLEKDYIFRTHKIKLHNAIKLLRLKTNSGKSIDLTENHKLLTIKDGEVCWADVKNLRKGDIVACPKSIDITGTNIKFDDFSDKLKNNYFKASKLSEPIKIPSNIDRDICSLIGYVIGDGHLDNYRVTICFNKTKEETENYKIISNIINKHFGIKNHYIENRAHSFVATWNRKSLADLLEMVGIQKGDKACTVNMHPKLLEINERNMCGLLSGLFSSDGSYYKDHLEFSSHSVSLAKQVQYLLLRVGINSSLSEPICKDCGRKKYRVLIYDTENFKIFLDKIGFMSSEKNKKIKINNRVDKKTSNTLPVNKLILKLSEIINVPPNKSSHFTYYKKGKMPTVRNLKIYLTYFKEKIETAKPILISRDIENFMKEMKISKRSFSEEIGLSREWLTKILNGKKPGKNANEKIKYGIEKYEKKIKEAELIIKQLEILCESNINWEKIKEINDIKNRPKYVYDITSTRNANYVANGLIVHNCGRMGEGGIGIGICLGSKRALEKSKSVIKEYRGLINKSLRWVENHPESVKNTNYATYIIAQSAINENLIGVIVSMCFNNDNGKPIFGLADADGETKISARAEGIDINDVISKAAKHVGGNSGGHLQAAGATIPTGTEDLFIQKCDELIKNAVLLN